MSIFKKPIDNRWPTTAANSNKTLTDVSNQVEEECQAAFGISSKQATSSVNDVQSNKKTMEEKSSEKENIDNDRVDDDDAQSTGSFEFNLFPESELEEDEEADKEPKTKTQSNSAKSDNNSNKNTPTNCESLNELIKSRRETDKELEKLKILKH